MDERMAWVALSQIEGFGYHRIKSLVDYFGSALDAFNAPEAVLEAVPGIGAKSARAVRKMRDEYDSEAFFDLLSERGIGFITIKDDDYPDLLRSIYSPPPVIYYKGKDTIDDTPKIAVVGTRRCSEYGRRVAEDLAGALASIGMVVVSGLAYGIDAAAHKGAIESGGRTWAVIGSGLDRVYPEGNRPLAEKITECGLLLSEYHPLKPASPGNFPARNRIISGLSLGTVVVEAGERSGALITAELALEQGREVFAVPGRIDDPRSRGTNGLIKDGAKLVEDVRDILQELGMVPQGAGGEDSDGSAGRHHQMELDGFLDKSVKGSESLENLVKALGFDMKAVNKLLELLDVERPADELVGSLGCDPARAIRLISMLEVYDIISRRPGGRFIRNGNRVPHID